MRPSSHPRRDPARPHWNKRDRSVTHIELNACRIELGRESARRLTVEVRNHEAVNLLLMKTTTQTHANTTGTACDDNNLFAQLHDQAA